MNAARSVLQNRHLIAAALIVSPQTGQGLVSSLIARYFATATPPSKLIVSPSEFTSQATQARTQATQATQAHPGNRRYSTPPLKRDTLAVSAESAAP